MDIEQSTRLTKVMTEFGTLSVLRNRRYQFLCMGDRIIHSILDLENPQNLISPVTQGMLLPLLLQENLPQHILNLGLGGGDICRFMTHYIKPLTQIAVEINPMVIDIARQYFQLPAQVEIINQDYQAYLGAKLRASTSRLMDYIAWDVFINDEMSLFDEQRNQQLFTACFNRLSPQGVLVINGVFADSQQCLHYLKSLRHCFAKRVICVELPQRKNIILFAFRQAPDFLSQAELTKRINLFEKRYELSFSPFLDNLFEINPTQTIGGEPVLMLYS